MTPSNRPKPCLKVQLGEDGECPLAGLRALKAIDSTGFYHAQRSMRQPLGIYNASLGRLLPRIVKFGSTVEGLFQQASIDPREENHLRESALDSLEAMLYAATEHVDDIEQLASGFFKTSKLASMDGRFRQLMNAIDRAKKLVATATNKIKHHQCRLRLMSIEITHAGHHTVLHGFYVEGVVDGDIAPHPALHREYPVRSITTIAWEVIDFIAAASDALERFLEHFPKNTEPTADQFCSVLNDAVLAVARLPAFTFGEPHPFSRRTVRLIRAQGQDARTDSGLYGSVAQPWIHSRDLKIGRISQVSAGDGVSTTFRFVSPKTISLVHWQADATP